jgi:glyoxylase-like metal-dependent hydrolase (beta-lactamase superfamily II)
VKWVIESEKILTYIYITHSHGDHFFGNGALLKQFPNTKVVSTPEVVAGMAAGIAPERMEAIWYKLFPGQIPEDVTAKATALKEDQFDIEGEKIQVIRTEHTDTDDTTAIWVPSIRLLVAGDAVYNNVHLYLGEGGSLKARLEWIGALEKLAALRPQAVVGGHHDPQKGFGPEAIEETKSYLQRFNQHDAEIAEIEQLYRKMLELHPTRLNPGSAWAGANASKNPNSIWALMAAKKK